MSLWDSIGSLFKGKPGAVARDADRVYIIDGEKMVEGRGGEKAGPIDRFQLLQRMAQFSEREQIRLHIVFAGRPLREVAHGGTYNGVKVYFVEQATGIVDQVDKLVRQSGRNVVVVSSDGQIEAKVSSRGATNMRIGTLRKALEGGGRGDEGNGDDSRFRQRRMRPRGGGRRPDRRDGQDRPDRQDQRPQMGSGPDGGGEMDHSSPAEPGNETTVKNLIDLVE